MDKEALQLVIVFSGLLGALVFGVVMLLTTRWARRNKADISQETRQTQVEDIEKVMREGRLPYLPEAFPPAALSKTQLAFGGMLSNLATVFVSLFLVFACFAMLKFI